jgi:hypothetical protein
MSHECFADEIAIDFPSVGRVVERMRDAFLGEAVDADVLRADVSLSQREAFAGLVVSVNVPVRVTCPHCGGRGETWTEWCDLCRGTGESLLITRARHGAAAGRRRRARSASASRRRCVIGARRSPRRDPFVGSLIPDP